MKVQFETITPETAQEYLERNTANYRKIRRGAVNLYAEDMRAGRWENNGEAIKFSSDGVLLDGQHRLAAIVSAGVPVKMLVVYGVDPSTTVYDVGSARTSGQILAANNFPSAITNTSVTGAANILITRNWSGHRVSKAGLVEYFSEHQSGWVEALVYCRTGANHPISLKAPVILACYCLRQHGADGGMLADFFSVVNSGFPAKDRESSSAIVLRNYLMAPTKTETLSESERRKMQFSVTVSAFQDFEAGLPRKRLYRMTPTTMRLLDWTRRREFPEE